METMGTRLKQERERLKLTQEKMAEYGNVNKRSQANYENGSRFPDAKYLAGVAKAGVHVDYVLSEASEHQRPKPDHLIREVGVNYDLSNTGQMPGNVEDFIAASRQAVQKIEAVLQKIKFQNAHTLIKNTLVNLLQHKQITIGGAEAVLVLMRDDHELHQEFIDKKT